MPIRCVILILGMLLSVSAWAWDESGDSIGYEATALATFSKGSNTPFWFVNNQQGFGSLKKNNGYLRAGVFGEMHRGHRFTWGWGAELAGGYNQEAPFVVQQLYGEVRYRAFQLSVGSKVRHAPFNDSRLSSGDLLFSENARPVPQIRVEIPDYITMPGTRGWFGFKGYASVGIFTDDNWQKHFVGETGRRTEHVLFHSKGAWVRIGNPRVFPLEFEGGLEMGAQWGGSVYRDGKLMLKMPHTMKDFLHVVFPHGGGENTPVGEQTNIYGNHTGEWSASLRWSGKGWGVRAYYEHYFEDHSQMFFDFVWKDCLVGIEAEFPANRVVSRLVYEFLYTKDQSGPVYLDHIAEIPEQVSGKDHYYGHAYYGGWQHWGMGLGNPLIISPVYNSPHSIGFQSSRIIGHHLGFEGKPLSRLGYRVLMSHTRSWGTYSVPYREVKANFSAMLELSYALKHIKGFTVSVAGALDTGSLIGKSAGVMISIRKSGSILSGGLWNRKCSNGSHCR